MVTGRKETGRKEAGTNFRRPKNSPGLFSPGLSSTPRVVLLGASNLTRGISTVVAMAGEVVGVPGDFLIAMGHGRSYGQRSTVLGRSLPGITECGLWAALRQGSGPTFALITDIGNDVIYGVPVETIVHWVTECVDRLREAGAAIVVTLPPMQSLETLTPWRFGVARTLLFPGRRMSLTTALDRSRALHDGLQSLGDRDGITLVEPLGHWYGVDPIHPRRRFLVRAWQQAIGPWGDGGAVPRKPSPSPARWLRLRTMTPQKWWLAGRRLGRAQPCGRLRDGTRLWLF